MGTAEGDEENITWMNQDIQNKLPDRIASHVLQMHTGYKCIQVLFLLRHRVPTIE